MYPRRRSAKKLPERKAQTTIIRERGGGSDRFEGEGKLGKSDLRPGSSPQDAPYEEKGAPEKRQQID